MYRIIFTRISTTFFSKIFRSTVDCWLLYISRRKQAQQYFKLCRNYNERNMDKCSINFWLPQIGQGRQKVVFCVHSFPKSTKRAIDTLHTQHKPWSSVVCFPYHNLTTPNKKFWVVLDVSVNLSPVFSIFCCLELWGYAHGV